MPVYVICNDLRHCMILSVWAFIQWQQHAIHYANVIFHNVQGTASLLSTLQLKFTHDRCLFTLQIFYKWVSCTGRYTNNRPGSQTPKLLYTCTSPRHVYWFLKYMYFRISATKSDVLKILSAHTFISDWTWLLPFLMFLVGQHISPQHYFRGLRYLINYLSDSVNLPASYYYPVNQSNFLLWHKLPAIPWNTALFGSHCQSACLRCCLL